MTRLADMPSAEGKVGIGPRGAQRQRQHVGNKPAIRYDYSMRRLIAILLMLVVPLQFSWAAIGSVDGHLDGSTPGFHVHHDSDHWHDGDGPAEHDSLADTDTHPSHTDDGYHTGHYHPVFSVILFDAATFFGETVRTGPPLRPPIAFRSHIPLLLDPPPLASL